ncbi:MAG: BMC domain-containing protein [Clostridia bacterium]|nr:BMC domain-containing protein [Clostridia bacterium]MCI9085392.1 BMC domain-containing protein [Clostridia bacterium]
MEYSLGLVEVSALGNAIIMLDDMLKAAEVEFVATERKLGGRLVTIVVRGELTSVKAAVDAGAARARQCNCLKASQVIARPHSEILKFLHLEEEDKTPNSEIAGTHVGATLAKTAAKTTSKSASKTTKKTTSTAAKRGRPKKTN